MDIMNIDTTIILLIILLSSVAITLHLMGKRDEAYAKLVAEENQWFDENTPFDVMPANWKEIMREERAWRATKKEE